MNQIIEAFKPLFDAAEEVENRILRSERIFARTKYLFDQRNHSTEGQWHQDYEDAERMIDDEDHYDEAMIETEYPESQEGQGLK